MQAATNTTGDIIFDALHLPLFHAGMRIVDLDGQEYQAAAADGNPECPAGTTVPQPPDAATRMNALAAYALQASVL